MSELKLIDTKKCVGGSYDGKFFSPARMSGPDSFEVAVVPQRTLPLDADENQTDDPVDFEKEVYTRRTVYLSEELAYCVWSPEKYSDEDVVKMVIAGYNG